MYSTITKTRPSGADSSTNIETDYQLMLSVIGIEQPRKVRKSSQYLEKYNLKAFDDKSTQKYSEP